MANHGKITRPPPELGHRIAEFAATDAALSALRGMKTPASKRQVRTFFDGGCLVFADALARWIGPAAEMIAVLIEDDEPNEEAWHLLIDHVVVRVGDVYYDAHGSHSRGEVIAHWVEQDDQHRWAAPFTVTQVEASHIRPPRPRSDALLSTMVSALGSPPPGLASARPGRGWRTIVGRFVTFDALHALLKPLRALPGVELVGQDGTRFGIIVERDSADRVLAMLRRDDVKFTEIDRQYVTGETWPTRRR